MKSVSGCRTVQAAPLAAAATVLAPKCRSVARGDRHSVSLRRFRASSAWSCASGAGGMSIRPLAPQRSRRALHRASAHYPSAGAMEG